MSVALSTSPEVEPQPSQSFWKRWIGVFVAPGATFADVARKPDFLAPMIVLVAASVAIAESTIAKIGMERIVRTALEHSSRGSSMTPEQLESVVRRGAEFATIFGHVGGVVLPPILMLIVAGIGLVIVNGIFGGEVNFETAFSIACYAWLVKIVQVIMSLAIIWFGDPETFNPESQAPTNVGFFLPPFETSRPLMVLASSADVFTVWNLVLLGIGFSRASQQKVKASSVFMIFFGVWLVYVLGRAGLATLGS